jgi:predicted nucleic acid-binding protein
MKAVLDASALLNIVRTLGTNALDYVRGCYKLTLTMYEIGNVIWKEATLLRRLSIDEALELLKLTLTVCRFLNTVDPKDSTTVLKLAHGLQITYYDASYVAVACELDLPLITDDTRLRKRVKTNMNIIAKVLGKEVDILSTNEYITHKR